MSDAETADRMLAAARAMVVDGGLTVSLEHLSFEDVIRDAGVARSAVYRRWPYKDLFWADVLVELASGVAPAVRANQDAIAAVNSTLLGWADRLEQPGARLAAAADALQQGALREFASFDSSPQWRTYFAIHATYFSLPDAELRERVGAALVLAEDAFNADLADSYRSIADMLGLRVKPATGLDFPAIAVLAMGLIRGLVLMAPGNPQIAARRFPAPAADAEPRPAADAGPRAADVPVADAGDGDAHSGWSLPAVGLAALTVDQLEADPAVRWDAARTDRLRNALTKSSWAPGPAGTAGNRH
ncbi:TetR/AcrR family transcriptional regulator [Nakamurella sp. DB0629]|uniref:TetR/AcrR family transcriptional regulator n=1 Tax=Nakamurella aerolata TaxID=1656892 RepID=A0A849A3Y4_9ACTN|nr:TetR/AcrR family transcriptional regulator [Nakamurella aerolata]